MFIFYCTGLGGEPSLADVGGPPNLLPLPKLDRNYDLAELPAMMNMKEGSALMIGAGAGPWKHLDSNCEMMANLSVPIDQSSGKIINSTRLATVDTSGQRVLHAVPTEQTHFSLLGNVLVTRGLPGTKVLHIRCHKRNGPDNFVTSMRKVLLQHYGDKPVGKILSTV